ncbi:RiPP maturation radical SAM protein 1 [Pyxidicoccus fallax]|uniref:RiPP maturation radical SAM protein 1 n=1 Tax=Pyxidicoccus fallax TaxID=394095 RepID=A0A848LJA1_9BACT|nr:RiPP maturation radical SAM C-methyltransferase [Pyxidicoccus fallax]NMO17803.1 RiPP maturation radical SAM protein 1 [Pyxidicoccus fallax]NPC85437.1 RiPP maturation radical SAM protein 1 [Pyxidicoccus fallax]
MHSPSARRLLLLCVPFQDIRLSSLSTTLLATLVRTRGHECTEAYVHFELARLIGFERYHDICTAGGARGLVGEMLFAEAYHGPLGDGAEEKLSALFGGAEERRTIMESFERYCLERVAEARPELVGMSTSCNQLLPSLWLARSIKQHFPGTRIVLGGSACSLPMGRRIKEFYPHIDYIVSGYGEEPLLALVRGEEPARGGIIVANAPVDLNSLPVPDYSAFLEEARAFGADASSRIMLAFEASRGCWWGMKHHCTFCGLNGTQMAFNAKSSERVAEEIRQLWEQYERNLFATDTILSRDHLKHALPELARHERKPHLFFEVKANMTAAEVQLLGSANVRWIQPGIESLSTRLLGLLDKGVSSIQNVALLKWCRELRIKVSWNLLCGIPGERIEDYDEQIALMEKIPHLQPTGGVSPIRIDRYSPYFERYASFGWREIKPLPEYRLLHPQLSAQPLSDIAYHFDGVGGIDLTGYYPRLKQAVSRWSERHGRGDGLFWDAQAGLVRIEGAEAYTFARDQRLERVLEHSNEIISVDSLSERAGCTSEFLVQLASLGILMIEGKRALNLAVRVGWGPR